MSSIEGLDELLATLSGLGGDIKEASRKGLERGAKRIQTNAKYLCPVRKPTKTHVKTKNGKYKKTKEGKTVWKAKSGGQLRNSIKTKSEATIDGVNAQVYVGAEYRSICRVSELGLEVLQAMLKNQKVQIFITIQDGWGKWRSHILHQHIFMLKIIIQLKKMWKNSYNKK